MTGFLLFLGVFAGIQVISYYGHKSKNHRAYTLRCTPPKIEEGDIVFKGSESGIDTEIIHNILIKRFPYYTSLDPSLQSVFLERLQAFMHSKTFIIKNDEGFFAVPAFFF